jgi:hypothetical protein
MISTQWVSMPCRPSRSGLVALPIFCALKECERGVPGISSDLAGTDRILSRLPVAGASFA